MKLLRIGAPGRERPCLLDPEGDYRDLGDHISDLAGEALHEATIARLQALDWRTLPRASKMDRIGPCVARPTNFVCIGLNYADHAREAGLPIPSEPVIFLKSLSAYCGPFDDIMIPLRSTKTDWEVELGVIIGRRAKNVSLDDALDHVCGYCICNDISEREFQMERGGTWDKGKGCDTFGPVGPWLVTKDEAGDTRKLRLWLDVDGRRMQDGATNAMIFDTPYLASYVSRYITLYPGDIISTGTPAGVGLAKKPEPIFLRAGQQMRLGISGLGEQRQNVIASGDALIDAPPIRRV